VKPKYELLAPGMAPEDYVRICNDNRRHETQEQAMSRAEKRRERLEGGVI
jgi:hypothetical protein